MNKEPDAIVPIQWVDGVLRLLDQRELPRVEQHVDCKTAGEVASAIRQMVVRGAPRDRHHCRLWYGAGDVRRRRL